MKTIARFEQRIMRYRPDLYSHDQAKALLEAKIKEEGLTPDWVSFEMLRPETAYRFTPKRKLKRFVAVFAGIVANIYWDGPDV